MTHTLKLDRLRTTHRWTAIGPTGRLGDYDDAEAAVLALREAGATSVALSVIGGPGVDFTPTIEQVAEALGESFAHLVPMLRLNFSGPITTEWAIVDGGREPIKDPHTHLPLFAGPTQADALRAAWAYITSRQEPSE